MTSFPAFELKRATIDADGVFAGYASVFNERDSYGDTILPGAFADSLAAHKAAGTRPALLWNHDAGAPVGRWDLIEEDARGLAVEGRLALETERGREAHALLKHKAIDGLSIGYFVPEGGAERTSEGRTIKRVELPEISLVTLPSNGKARVLEVRSWQAPGDAEQALRDAGLSRREAKALLAQGWRGLSGDTENHETEILTALRRIESATARWRK